MTSYNEKRPFVSTTPTLHLSQRDVADAVEFWLNERVLKSPCEVTSIVRSTDHAAGFVVDLKTREESNEKAFKAPA